MRLKAPMTGTVLDFDADVAKLDGIGISGDPNDPVAIAVDLGNVSWKLIGFDLATDMAEIEVTPGENISVLKAGGGPKNPADWITRPTTPAEKQGFLDNAQSIVANYTIDPAKRLVKSADAVEKYMAFLKEMGL